MTHLTQILPAMPSEIALLAQEAQAAQAARQARHEERARKAELARQEEKALQDREMLTHLLQAGIKGVADDGSLSFLAVQGIPINILIFMDCELLAGRTHPGIHSLGKRQELADMDRQRELFSKLFSEQEQVDWAVSVMRLVIENSGLIEPKSQP